MRKYFIFIIIITLPIQTKAQTFVTDIDGNTYNTVTFGNQEWMRENLRTTHLNENTPILHAADTSLWCNLTDEPAYCWYENNYTTNTIIRGILYNWYAVNTANLCPSGWHVPNITEWQNLVDYLGGLSTAGPKMRGVGSSYYSATGSTCANNSSGLSLGATGIRFEDGSFEGIDFWGGWWSSDEDNESNSYLINLDKCYLGLPKSGKKRDAMGVRCIKDSTTETTLTIIKKTMENKIFPNPAKDCIYINSDNPEGITVTIMDLQGKEVINSLVTLNEVDISHLPKGMYLVVISDQRDITINKLIKE